MHTTLPQLHVVIVTFNSECQIERCLSSLARAAQGFETRVRVVDNASTDDTVQRVERLGQELRSPDFCIELLRQERNLGFTRGMNRGLDDFHADALLWLNPDVYLEEDALAELWTVLQSDTQRGAVAPQLLNPDGSIQPSCRRFPSQRDILFEIAGLPRLFPRSGFFARWKMGDFDHRAAAQVEQPQGACLLVRGEVANSLGPLDERFQMFFSDVDYCRRIYEAGYHIWFEPRARATHERGASVFQVRAEMIRQSHRDLVRYFDKWHPDEKWLNRILRAALALVLPLRLLGTKLAGLRRSAWYGRTAGSETQTKVSVGNDDRGESRARKVVLPSEGSQR